MPAPGRYVGCCCSVTSRAWTRSVKDRTLGIDATTVEANAALWNIVRRDTGESYEAFLTRLTQTSDIATPTRADLDNRSPLGPSRRCVGR